MKNTYDIENVKAIVVDFIIKILDIKCICSFNTQVSKHLNI